MRPSFLPDRPGPAVSLHVLRTGYGRMWVDRWPSPRAIVAGVGENWSLCGDPHSLQPEELASCIASGMIDAPAAFEPLLRRAWPDLQLWDRVILSQPRPVEVPAGPVRRLEGADAAHLGGLGEHLTWISETLGGPAGLASSRLGWGAFADGRLASVAVPFTVGEGFEDLGVVTEAGYRGRGLSPACAARVAEDVRRRGRIPSWSTSPDNAASLRVAHKLGFEVDRDDRLFVVGRPVPGVAQRE